ncbi:MAG: hypothetical protein QOD09_150 [Bradyrhizobium sp.]|nr:hypothetical protein [Bradyrhizobium sp.]
MSQAGTDFDPSDAVYPMKPNQRRQAALYPLLLAARRGFVFVGCLFALFCTSLDVERLGQAFDGNRIER